MVINVKNISQNLVQGIAIKKTYGDMWTKVSDKHYNIKIQQLDRKSVV